MPKKETDFGDEAVNFSDSGCSLVTRRHPGQVEILVFL
jgi:hypothetical protein